MMSTIRRHRYTALTFVLTILVIWYLATAQDTTRNTPFYQKTAAAIDKRRNEGPQAPGPAHRQYLKGGSIRPEEQKPIDTSPIDDTEDLMRQVERQVGKDADLTAQVEGLGRGLGDAEENARAGKTAGDIALEKQIIQARKREQEKLKEELRNQLKQKERERQKLLSGKYTNPNWVGAFEKEQKPPVVLGALELEKAPDLDPFRDAPAAAPRQPSVPIVREQAPSVDPLRNKPAVEQYQVPVPMGGAGMDNLAQIEQKSEQQQEQLVKEQEYLDPVRPEPVEPSTMKTGKSQRPAVEEEEPVKQSAVKTGKSQRPAVIEEEQEYVDPVKQSTVKPGKPKQVAAVKEESEQFVEEQEYLDPVKQSTVKTRKPKQPAALEDEPKNILEEEEYLNPVKQSTGKAGKPKQPAAVEEEPKRFVEQQEDLNPVKQPTVKTGKSKRPAVVREEPKTLDDLDVSDDHASLEEVQEDTKSPSKRKHDPFTDAVVKGREARKASEVAPGDEGEYVPDRHAYKVTEHEDGHQAKMGREHADDVDIEARVIKAKTTTTAAAARPTKKEVKAAINTVTSSKSTAPTGPPAHKTPAELELSRLLALSPITIFSKTRCPFSKKAKHILTEVFQIMPSPYIVELDTHEHGPELQQLLKQKTGRSTVPNIIVNGKSLGGGDDVESLWQRGELRDKLRDMGGKRILSVEEVQTQ